MRPLRLLTAGMLAIALGGPGLAQAQEGFALNRYEPAEPGSDWFANESLDFRGALRPSAGLVLDYAHEPLVAYDQDGERAAAVVGTQFFAHLGGAVVLWDRMRVGLGVPVLLLGMGDRVVTPDGDYATDEGFALGDPRVAADVRLAGLYGSPFTLAVGAQVFVPAGSRDAFTSDGTLRVRPRLLAAGDVGPFAYALQGGLHVRPHEAPFAGAELGHEVVFAAAAGVRLLDRDLIVGPELFGSSLLGGGSTPVELALGGKYTLAKDFHVGLAAGPGLNQGLGAPLARVLASFEWIPAIDEERDRDGDGVLDRDDRCPSRPAGDRPDPRRPGCPARDSDGDGLMDFEDACPFEAGVLHLDPRRHGCPPDPPPPPPPDTDGDGIVDALDACPSEPGVKQSDPAKHGCPRVRLEQETKQIRIIQRIEFEYDKDTLTPDSHAVLEDVRAILAEHPEITLIEIQGHTDNVGGEDYNVTLSEARAQTVRKWLVDHGIDAARLRAVGLGLAKPIDTNDTEQGRQQNRRVEFHIREQDLDGDGKPDPASSAPAPGSAPAGSAPAGSAPAGSAPAGSAPAGSAPAPSTPAPAGSAGAGSPPAPPAGPPAGAGAPAPGAAPAPKPAAKK